MIIHPEMFEHLHRQKQRIIINIRRNHELAIKLNNSANLLIQLGDSLLINPKQLKNLGRISLFKRKKFLKKLLNLPKKIGHTTSLKINLGFNIKTRTYQIYLLYLYNCVQLI